MLITVLLFLGAATAYSLWKIYHGKDAGPNLMAVCLYAVVGIALWKSLG